MPKSLGYKLAMVVVDKMQMDADQGPYWGTHVPTDYCEGSEQYNFFPVIYSIRSQSASV